MEYGVDESKLRPFEKLLQALEGKLMEGHIFKVREVWPRPSPISACTCIVCRLVCTRQCTYMVVIVVSVHVCACALIHVGGPIIY